MATLIVSRNLKNGTSVRYRHNISSISEMSLGNEPISSIEAMHCYVLYYFNLSQSRTSLAIGT